MNIFSFLDFATTVAACIITLFLAIPAYKLTKQKGFVFWSFAALGSLWNTITLHAFLGPAARHFVFYSYKILFVLDGVSSIIGTILIIQGYQLLFKMKASPLADESPGESRP
jgi:hypothetical protein